MGTIVGDLECNNYYKLFTLYWACSIYQFAILNYTLDGDLDRTIVPLYIVKLCMSAVMYLTLCFLK